MKTISISPGWKAAAEAISHILAPLSSKDREMVRTVQLGKIKIHPDGQEADVHSAL